ncbi:MAG TPA: metalloregulator ArsR/SmtB family transcription factor [Chloroflexota bacterium]|nr:metalloregulator ArsR/SmtB family transcription factor [Chloroflexota bacterium]
MPVTLSVMPSLEAVRFLKAIADETRLAILGLLALTDLRGGEIVARLGLPANAVSYHLKQLRDLGVLRDRRGHADGRDVYYRLDLDRLRMLYREAGQALHPMLSPEDPVAPGAEGIPAGRPIRVLFLCTHNSARSQLSEAILRLRGGGAVEVASAGDHPTEVHPLAIALLQEHDIDSSQYVAKSLERFVDQSFDYIITVCDRVKDHCPVFPNDPVRIHWSFPDPTVIEDEAARSQAFSTLWLELNIRIGHLLNLPHPVSGRRTRARSLASTRESPSPRETQSHE